MRIWPAPNMRERLLRIKLELQHQLLDAEMVKQQASSNVSLLKNSIALMDQRLDEFDKEEMGK